MNGNGNRNRPGMGWRQSLHPMSPDYQQQKITHMAPLGQSGTDPRDDNPETRTATPVQLPFHLFIPPGAQSWDPRIAADVLANTTAPTLLWSFRVPKGAMLHIFSYAIFSDGTLAANQEFIPRVNGSRVFPYQGDPTDEFKINLGLAPDLSNNSLITCQLTLNPNDLIEWFVINRNVVDVAMGVRMSGYIDRDQRRINARVGG